MSKLFADYDPEQWQEDGVLAVKPTHVAARRNALSSKFAWPVFRIASYAVGTALTFSSPLVAAKDAFLLGREAYSVRAGPGVDVVPDHYWERLGQAVHHLPQVGDGADDVDIDPFV